MKTWNFWKKRILILFLERLVILPILLIQTAILCFWETRHFMTVSGLQKASAAIKSAMRSCIGGRHLVRFVQRQIGPKINSIYGRI